MSLLDTITALATSDGDGDGAYTITRRAPGTTMLGRYTPGATSTFPITAVVVPFGQNELIVLPEGQHVEDTRVVYTSTHLHATPGAPDLITIGGDPFAVLAVQGPYELDGDTHFVAYVARQRIPGA